MFDNWCCGELPSSDFDVVTFGFGDYSCFMDIIIINLIFHYSFSYDLLIISVNSIA